MLRLSEELLSSLECLDVQSSLFPLLLDRTDFLARRVHFSTLLDYLV